MNRSQQLQDLNTFELNMPNSIRPFQERNENNNDSFVLWLVVSLSWLFGEFYCIRDSNSGSHITQLSSSLFLSNCLVSRVSQTRHDTTRNQLRKIKPQVRLSPSTDVTSNASTSGREHSLNCWIQTVSLEITFECMSIIVTLSVGPIAPCIPISTSHQHFSCVN